MKIDIAEMRKRAEAAMEGRCSWSVGPDVILRLLREVELLREALEAIEKHAGAKWCAVYCGDALNWVERNARAALAGGDTKDEAHGAEETKLEEAYAELQRHEGDWGR